MNMKLTDRQERFAQLLADGSSQADAYRQVYDISKMKLNSIYQRASKVAAGVKVASRVKELKEKLTEKYLWTREQSIQVLSEIAKAEEVRANEKVSAIKELNAMHGFNAPTKQEISVSFPRDIHVIAGRS